MGETKPPAREMSSRLLTMKFIQRAAAAPKSASSSSPTTPNSTKKHRTDDEDDNDVERSSKRLRVIDRAAVDAALKEQEARRQAALEKHTTELGDTHWVLDGAVAMAMQKRAQEEKRKAEMAEKEVKMAFVSQADLDRWDRPTEEEEEEEEEAEEAAKGRGKKKGPERGVRQYEEGRIRTANFKRKSDKAPVEEAEESPKERGSSSGKKSGGGGISQNGSRNNSWGNDKKRKKGAPTSISAGGR